MFRSMAACSYTVRKPPRSQSIAPKQLTIGRRAVRAFREWFDLHQLGQRQRQYREYHLAYFGAS